MVYPRFMPATRFPIRVGRKSRLPLRLLFGVQADDTWITAIGVRRSFRHRDVTFGGSPHGGVRIDFTIPVRWTILEVPAIYVPADDLDGLAAELERRGVAGRDLSRRAG